MDIADQAQRFEEINLAQSLKVHTENAKYTRRQIAKGYCLNLECGEDFGDETTGRLYCGPACATQHGKQLHLLNERKETR